MSELTLFPSYLSEGSCHFCWNGDMDVSLLWGDWTKDLSVLYDVGKGNVALSEYQQVYFYELVNCCHIWKPGALEFCWQPLIILSVAEQKTWYSETRCPLICYRTFGKISVRRYKVIKLLTDLVLTFFFFFLIQLRKTTEQILLTWKNTFWKISPGNNNVASSNTWKMEDPLKRAILNLPDSFG